MWYSLVINKNILFCICNNTVFYKYVILKIKIGHLCLKHLTFHYFTSYIFFFRETMESLLNKHGFPRVPFPFHIDDDTLLQREAFLTRGMYVFLSVIS